MIKDGKYYFNFEETYFSFKNISTKWLGLKGIYTFGDIIEHFVIEHCPAPAPVCGLWAIEIYDTKYGSWIIDYPVELILKLIDEGKIVKLTDDDLLIKDIIE